MPQMTQAQTPTLSREAWAVMLGCQPPPPEAVPSTTARARPARASRWT